MSTGRGEGDSKAQRTRKKQNYRNREFQADEGSGSNESDTDDDFETPHYGKRQRTLSETSSGSNDGSDDEASHSREGDNSDGGSTSNDGISSGASGSVTNSDAQVDADEFQEEEGNREDDNSNNGSGSGNDAHSRDSPPHNDGVQLNAGNHEVEDLNDGIAENEDHLLDDEQQYDGRQQHGGEHDQNAQDFNCIYDRESDSEDAQSEAAESSSSSSDEEENNGNPQANQPPLYLDAPLTVDESLLSILTFSLKHQLSGACLADLLDLIAIHCPNNLCVRTLHNFKKYFRHLDASVIKLHFYCSKCIYPLREKNAECNICHRRNNISYFIELPLKDQLAKLMQREGFYDKLQFRFNRHKINNDHFEDIYDGELYREYYDDTGFLRNPNNISLLGYTDGVSVFNTSTTEMWPVCFQINELPYKDRVRKENVILAGLWCSSKKPSPNVFLQPFHAALHNFKENGYNLPVLGQGEKLIKGMLLAWTCDLPAKAKFMRMVAHNGFFGCARCEKPGQRHPVGRTTIHVYPYSDILMSRTHDETLVYAQQARQLRQGNNEVNVKGVKGISVLYNMLPDFIRSMAIDVMHGGFHGISKLLVGLWFDSSLSEQPFYLYHVLDLVDSRLQKIAPPSTVQRMPRSIKKQLAYWKALEYKMFFLYYSVLVLKGLMEEQYYLHHCKLVSGIYLLSQDSVSSDDIQRASELLTDYVKNFAELYGLRWLTLNVHQLLHFHDVVLDLEPLWVYSCFPWEDLNSKLVKLVHGTRFAALQIARASSYIMNLPYLVSKLPECPARLFCENILHSQKKVKVAEVISETEVAVGAYKPANRIPLHLQNLLASCGLIGGKVSMFYRLKRKGLLYYSLSYERATQKNSSYVSYEKDNVSGLCAVDYFVRWSACGANCVEGCRACDRQFLCIGVDYYREQWEVHNMDDVRLSYCSKVRSTEVLTAFPIDCISGLCHYVTIDQEEYILNSINRLEIE